MRILIGVGVVAVLFSSCTLINKIQDKLFPYRNKSVDDIAVQKPASPKQTPAPVQVTITPKAEPAKTSEPQPVKIETPVPKTTINNTNSKPIAEAPREFRAAWIATVANINWPSKPGLSADEQKAEAINLLDYLQNNNFNAVIFQVRPQADALYKSDIEPWSYYLTGQQDKAPDPFYDPLEFWIEESHKRGMELHAWLNPYRAHHASGKEISNRSVVRTNPELVYLLKEGYWWMDPSLKATQDRTSKVVMDIVKRYDLDGIHFDDYFYPYPSYNGDKDFPDDNSWNEYVRNGGKLERGDWRRESVNKLIQRLYQEIKTEKQHVKFGLSPFGIWRPGYPASVEGFDQYDKLYADAKLWLNKGWIDYFTPQLYWPTNRIAQSFPVLLGWWQSENTLQRHLWPGISIGTDKNGIANNQEVLSEIMISRGMLPKSQGIVHWNISSLTKNPSLTQALRDGPYKLPALIPASPWLNTQRPASPSIATSTNNGALFINWTPKDDKAFRWVVYGEYGDKWEYQILTRDQNFASLKLQTSDKNGKPILLKRIMVTAVDRTGNESMQQPQNVE
jgi:uncharacterized lipoprotein YddW (UPF0748 family)